MEASLIHADHRVVVAPQARGVATLSAEPLLAPLPAWELQCARHYMEHLQERAARESAGTVVARAYEMELRYTLFAAGKTVEEAVKQAAAAFKQRQAAQQQAASPCPVTPTGPVGGVSEGRVAKRKKRVGLKGPHSARTYAGCVAARSALAATAGSASSSTSSSASSSTSSIFTASAVGLASAPASGMCGPSAQAAPAAAISVPTTVGAASSTPAAPAPALLAPHSSTLPPLPTTGHAAPPAAPEASMARDASLLAEMDALLGPEWLAGLEALMDMDMQLGMDAQPGIPVQPCMDALPDFDGSALLVSGALAELGPADMPASTLEASLSAAGSQCMVDAAADWDWDWSACLEAGAAAAGTN